MKSVLRILLCVVLVALIAAGGYASYVFIAYHRIGNQLLPVEGKTGGMATANTAYRVVAWNIGFGAYESDYGFFMDGGTQSWAWSKERLDKNLAAIAACLRAEAPDFCLIQEIDSDATRTYHTDECAALCSVLTDDEFATSYAQNYDSPFLLYPFTQPHGASKSGLLTFSAHGMASAFRHELPIESGFAKIIDLDRCYSASRVPVEGGGELVLYNLHLSAYTSDGSIATEQLKLLLGDMQREYEAGNWCVAGGDFNKDLLGDSSQYFTAADKTYNWAQPIPAGVFEGADIVLVAPLDEANPVPSCRNADGPYNEKQYVLTVDGFLISPNVAVEESRVIDTGFAYSDHNPVAMTCALR